MPASSVAPDQAPVSASGRRGHADPLLDAVLRRDPRAASRHLSAWVHRRGVNSLDAWMVTDLPSLAGDEGYYWLAGLLESPLISSVASEIPTLQEPGHGAERASRALDRALAELAGTFPEFGAPTTPVLATLEPGPASAPLVMPEPVAEAGPLTQPELLAEADGVLDSSCSGPDLRFTPTSLEGELQPTFAGNGISARQAESDALTAEPLVSGPGPVGLEFSPPESPVPERSEPELSQPELPEPEPSEPELSGLDQPVDEALLSEAEAAPQQAPLALGRWARRSLGRARTLLRDCYEEAIGTLHAEPVDSAEHFEIGPVSEPEPPVPAVAPVAPTSFAVGAPLTSSAGAPPPPPAHWDRAAAAAPGSIGQPASVEPSAATARLLAPGLFKGRRASNRPAPAPAALADLRAWLPDAAEAPRRAS